MLGAYIEKKLKATFMRNANIKNGYFFMKKVYNKVDDMFGAMMRGEDMTSKLQSYLPIKMEHYKARRILSINWPEWQISFFNTFESYESRHGNAKYRTKMMITESNLISFNLSSSSMGGHPPMCL